MRPSRLPDLPRGYGVGRYRVSRRNRVVAAWRSACAACVAAVNTLVRVIAGF